MHTDTLQRFDVILVRLLTILWPIFDQTTTIFWNHLFTFTSFDNNLSFLTMILPCIRGGQYFGFSVMFGHIILHSAFTMQCIKIACQLITAKFFEGESACKFLVWWAEDPFQYCMKADLVNINKLLTLIIKKNNKLLLHCWSIFTIWFLWTQSFTVWPAAWNEQCLH